MSAANSMKILATALPEFQKQWQKDPRIIPLDHIVSPTKKLLYLRRSAIIQSSRAAHYVSGYIEIHNDKNPNFELTRKTYKRYFENVKSRANEYFQIGTGDYGATYNYFFEDIVECSIEEQVYHKIHLANYPLPAENCRLILS